MLDDCVLEVDNGHESRLTIPFAQHVGVLIHRERLQACSNQARFRNATKVEDANDTSRQIRKAGKAEYSASFSVAALRGASSSESACKQPAKRQVMLGRPVGNRSYL